MCDVRTPTVIDDLRFALDVLEARSHMGMDPEYVSKLRSVILQQIERREATQNYRHPIGTSTAFGIQTVKA
jgi:hypothetical protein